MTGTRRRRVEKLERAAGAHNGLVRITFHKPGEPVAPGTRLITFTLDHPHNPDLGDDHADDVPSST